MNEIEKILSGLQDQRDYWKMRYKLNNDKDSNKYVTVIDMAIKALEENIKLNKQNEEIQNSNIEYYNRAKDAEDRWKKIAQQNARLKELLKAASEDIRTWLVSDDCEKVCREAVCHCTTVEQCRNICKWRYADKIEEILKDE